MNRQDAQKILKQQYLGIRGAALYALQLPLWLAIPVNLIRGKLLGVATAAVAIGLLCYAAALTRQHFQSRRNNYIKTGSDHADVDNRPYALAFTALAAATTAFSVRPGIAFALISALLAAAGYYLGYIHDSRPEDAYQAPPRHIPDHLNATLRDMLSGGFEAVETLEKYTVRLQSLASEANIAAQMARVTSQARSIIAHIGEEPERIRAARSFLVVHLHELRRIAAAYLADIGNPDHGRQQIRFHNLLADSEHSFTAQHLQLTNQQQEQLDTQIQVLRDQLKTGNQP